MHLYTQQVISKEKENLSTRISIYSISDPFLGVWRRKSDQINRDSDPLYISHNSFFQHTFCLTV